MEYCIYRYVAAKDSYLLYPVVLYKGYFGDKEIGAIWWWVAWIDPAV